MARYKGHEGALTAATQNVGEVESFDITIESATLDANVMGSDWTGVDGGQKTGNGTVSFLYDPGDAGQESFIAGAKVACTFYPAGNTTSLVEISGSFLIVDVTRTTAVGDLVKKTATIRSDGAVTEVVIL